MKPIILHTNKKLLLETSFGSIYLFSTPLPHRTTSNTTKITTMTIRIQTAGCLFLSLLTVQKRVRARDECTIGSDGTCVADDELSSSSSKNNNNKPRRLECGVYMAPSTLGEDTNMGIYAGIPLQEGDVVNFPEIAIPLLFREWGDHKPGYGTYYIIHNCVVCVCVTYRNSVTG